LADRALAAQKRLGGFFLRFTIRKAAGLESRVGTASGDFFNDPLPKAEGRDAVRQLLLFIWNFWRYKSDN
jgi:hypothetical protein